MAQAPPLKLPRELALAERWAKELGRTVQRGSGTGPQGEFPVIRIQHGKYPVFVRMQGKCISVFTIAEVEPGARVKLAALEAEDQQRALLLFADELMSNPRAGSSWTPQENMTLPTLERFSVEELLTIRNRTPRPATDS